MEQITNESMCFFTQQVFLIGTYNEDGTANFAPISWISFTAGPPCCLVISIYGKNGKKHTTQNILRTGVLSATVVTPDLLPFAEQHNAATQHDHATLSQTFTRGHVLNVPLIEHTKWSYECEVIQTVSIGDCDTFFAKFKQVNVQEDVQMLDFIDLQKIQPVVYSPDHYFSIGDPLGRIGDYADSIKTNEK